MEDAKLNASNQRDSFMENLAEAWSQMEGTRFAGVLESLMLQENQ